MNAAAIVVGADIGTSSVKVLAAQLDGRIVALTKRDYVTRSPAREAAEQDLHEIERASAEALAAVLTAVGDPTRVEAIGFSCAMHGVVPLDAAGEPLGPLVTWLDRRGLAVADRWRENGTATALYRLTGAPVHPMLPSCKVRAFRDAGADAYLRAARYVSAKEYVIARLTGTWAIDYGMASGTGLYEPSQRRWCDAALAAAGITAASLSPLAAPSTSFPARGSLARDLGIKPHTQIVLGSSDGALANLGAGAARPGTIAASLGSSGAVRVVSETFDVDAEARTFCYAFDDTRYLVGGSTSSGGSVLTAFFSWLLPDVPPEERFERACGLAARSPIGARGILVRPDLAGARAPSWDASRKGSIDGLALDTTREDAIRAVFEATARDLATVCALVGDRAPGAPVRTTGGNFEARFLRQLFADMADRDLVKTEPGEASAFGAALIAARSIGILANDAAEKLVRETELTHPQPDAARTYARLERRASSDRL